MNKLENFTTEDKLFIERKQAQLKKMEKKYFLETPEQETYKNVEIISGFIEHCKREGFDIPETLFESYFNA